jgi:parallel beta helix pectate lyase-like protein
MPLIALGDDVVATVAAGAAGTAYTFAPGVHRIVAPIAPKDGDTFAGVGYRTATISGAKVLTGWIQSGATWYVTGQTQTETQDATSHCTVGTACEYPMDVWFDEGIKDRVLTLGAVTTGTWFFDDASNRIYVGDDPTTAGVETSVASRAFYSSADNVTIDQLVVTRFACNLQTGAVESNGGENWTVTDNEISHCHGTGLRTHAGMTWARNYIHHHQQMGVVGGNGGVDGAPGTPMSMIDNEIAFNNYRNLYQVGHEAGGVKIVFSNDFTASGNNVHHNVGIGLWMDINNYDYELFENTCDDNTFPGIFIEISQGGLIHDNVVRRNGTDIQGNWEVLAAGIAVAASHDVEIYDNIVEGSYYGISIFQQTRSELQPELLHPNYGELNDHRCYNINVHDNTIANANACINGVNVDNGTEADVCDLTTTAVDKRGNVRWEGNEYRVSLGSHAIAYFAWNGAARTFTAWQGFTHDDTGSYASYASYTPYGETEEVNTVVVTDPFERGNSVGLGMEWTDVQGGWNVLGNQAVSREPAVNNVSAYTGTLWTSGGGSDQYASVVIQSMGISLGGPAVRLSASVEEGYFFEVSGFGGGGLSAHRIKKMLGGTYYLIATFPAEVNIGDRVGLEIRGTELRASVNDIVVYIMNDTDVVNGYPGLYGYHTDLVFDDFVAGVFGVNGLQDLMSAMNFACPWRGPMVDASVNPATNASIQASMYFFSGILAQEVMTVKPWLFLSNSHVHQ